MRCEGDGILRRCRNEGAEEAIVQVQRYGYEFSAQCEVVQLCIIYLRILASSSNSKRR